MIIGNYLQGRAQLYWRNLEHDPNPTPVGKIHKNNKFTYLNFPSPPSIDLFLSPLFNSVLNTLCHADSQICINKLYMTSYS